MDQHTRDKVLNKMTTERDLRNQMAYAKQKAQEEGRKEGLSQGRAEAQLEMARKLKALGMATDTIVQATGLDLDTIESL